MNKAILYNGFGVLLVLGVIFFKIPFWWVFFLVVVFLIFVISAPFMPLVESIPKGFVEKRFDTGEVILNYIEGPNNGEPILFIPGQMEFWQGYKLVIPSFAKKYHVFVVDVRGHGKSTRTPGRYSYNIIGEDLKEFLQQVVKKPAVVSGLSSGAILSLWLAGNAPEFVSTAISEDPPLFSSMTPRINEEKYMYRIFDVAVECLGSEPRDVLGFFMKQGIPKDGYDKLFLIPPWIAKFIVGLFVLNKKFRPKKQYDIPLAPFSGRVGFKFLCEYDVDFSKATIDGRLTEGFNPEETLKKIVCPVLFIQARWSRHKTWGLLGALDDNDVKKARSLIKNSTVVKVNAIHDVHLAKPKIFIKTVNEYLNTQMMN
jgi:pimeloyl-ACP methyl ester carboxylesterase